MNLGFYSYLGATIGFSVLTVLLLPSWRSSVQGKLLTAVALASALWAGFAVVVASGGARWIGAYQAFEILRYVAWYVFLLRLLAPAAQQNTAYRHFLRWALPVSTGFALLLLTAELGSIYLLTPVEVNELAGARIVGHIFLAIIGLAIIEQLFRNISVRHRWAIKYLFLGAGGIFAYDFYMHADALLFRGIDEDLWEARGFVNLVAVPLLAIAAARNESWSLNIFVSRDIVLNTTTIVLGGLYLLVMAGVGYYLREFGGNWGSVIQALFLVLMIALLAVVLFSGQLRAQLRVFLGKHFYRNKYDYRREWLQLTDELNERIQGKDSFEGVIRVLAQIVDARAGLLWLGDGHMRYENVATWQTGRIQVVEEGDGPLVRFLEAKGHIINLSEFETRPDEYQGLDLPEWLTEIPRGWLVVPLAGLDALQGFVVLANPLVQRSINWEDRDLLKTAAKQVASHLSVLMTSEALAEARQFEVFNRLSAYMVHDLKNIAAELEMVARNAEKHKGNTAFLEDAFDTVSGASTEIKRLLEQLRNKRARMDKKSVVDLGPLVKEVVAKKQARSPAPVLSDAVDSYLVVAEKNRLSQVVAHLIDNAQQATAADGRVEVKLAQKASMVITEIRDNGCGMDGDFIQHRLFRPFDTTKGNAGMGIGMYESREFIRELGGEIQVESEPGVGTMIALHIPQYAG